MKDRDEVTYQYGGFPGDWMVAVVIKAGFFNSLIWDDFLDRPSEVKNSNLMPIGKLANAPGYRSLLDSIHAKIKQHKEPTQ